MRTIKVSTSQKDKTLLRQSPNGVGIWDKNQFLINENNIECDWYVVLDDIKNEEEIICDPEHTILITVEPPSIKKYNKKFLKQFHTIITFQNIYGSNIVNFPILPWYIGAHYNLKEKRFDKFTKSYDELKKTHPIKSKTLSIITSDKTRTSGHKARMKFLQIVKKHFGEQIDVFGARINTIPDKWDGIAPYKYHLAIENSSYYNYFSEKLSDAFLSESYPIYFGCKNIFDYFPKNSMTLIDINNPDEAIDKIKRVIDGNYFDKFHDEIIQSKNLILDHYQFFPKISEIINNLSEKKCCSNQSEKIKIMPERYFVESSLKSKVATKFKFAFKHLLKVFIYRLREVSKIIILKLARITKINLLLLSYKDIGILNYKSSRISGEQFLLEKYLPSRIKNPNPILFDVGANVGEYSIALSQIKNSTVFAFEPNVDSIKVLKEKIHNKNIRAYNFGLSSRSGESNLYLNQNDSKSELATLYKEVIEDIHNQSSIQQVAKLQTLDEFCVKNNISYIDFIKIDTEGHELEVLKGAMSTISAGKIEMIQFEFNEMNIISKVFLKDFYDLLKNYQFYRLKENGLISLGPYSTDNEIFKFQNILAIKNTGDII